VNRKAMPELWEVRLIKRKENSVNADFGRIKGNKREEMAI
jgi:hypothetical protein